MILKRWAGKLKRNFLKWNINIIKKRNKAKLLKLLSKSNIKRNALYKVKYWGLIEVQKDEKYIGRKVFTQIAQEIGKQNNIRVGFVAYSANIWPCDELYQMMDRSVRFKPYVLVVKDEHLSASERRYHYEEVINFIVRKKYRYIEVSNKNIKSINAQFDILFFFSPYNNIIPSNFNVQNLSMSILLCHIPYYIGTVNDNNAQYNLIAHQCYWKYYVPTYIHKLLAKSYATLGDYNIVVSGYPHLDEFSIRSDKEIKWKIVNKDKCKAKIIYAPTHGQLDDKFETFQYNFKYILQFAKEHKETTSWIFRPHQNLKTSSVQTGVFNSTLDYDTYVKEWESLPNAGVSLTGDPSGLLQSCDGIVLDCITFITEAVYLDKKVLFLTKNENDFNLYGQKLIKVIYTVDGKALDEIGHSLEKIFIEDKDDKAIERRMFYQKFLDYYKYNNKTASQFIMDDIIDGLKIKDN